MKTIKKPTVLLERFPYRYIQCGTLEINGMPDCHDYTCWLDPDGVPCYVTGDVVTARGRGVT